jgi:anti-sigma B factor antagonist
MTWPCPPSVPPVAIESQTSHGTTTVFVSGELDLVTMPILREYLTPILRGRPKRLILELSGIKFIDCGSARLIADVGRSLPPGQRPVIRRPPPGVRKVFQLTGLDAYCEIEG